MAREYLASKGVAEPSAALVKGLLMHTAFDMYPGQYGEVGRASGQEMLQRGPNNNQGYGRVDMDRLTETNGNDQFIDQRTGVAVGENLAFKVSNSGFTQLKVTLVYTDYPGSPSVQKTLVNNIDLSVADSSGQELASSTSQANNSEQITLSQVPAGDLQVLVRGVNVPQGRNGKQPFALLISGR